jgi:hypothetical protein
MINKILIGLCVFIGLNMIFVSLLVCNIMIFGIINFIFGTEMVLLIMSPILKILISLLLFWSFFIFTMFICILFYDAYQIIKFSISYFRNGGIQ